MRAGLCAAAVVAMLGLTTACSGSGSGPAGPAPTASSPAQFAELLRHIAPPKESNYTVEFSDYARGRALYAGADPSRMPPFDAINRHAAPIELTDPGDFTTRTGISLDAATSGIWLGDLAHTDAGFLYGSFDAAGIGARLAGLGYQRHDLQGGEAEWTFPAGHTRFVVSTAFDTIRIRADRIVYGSATADVDAATAAASAPVTADPAVAALAGCLGPVVMATIDTTRENVPERVAAGQIAKSGSDLDDELCVANSDDATAQAVAKRIKDQMSTSHPPVYEVSWSELFPHPTIEVLGGNEHLVRFSGQKGVERGDWPIREMTTLGFTAFLGTTPVTP